MPLSARLAGPPRPGSRAAVGGLVLLAVLAITAALATHTRPGGAQGPFPEPAFAALLNLSGAFRNVELHRVTDDGGTTRIERAAVSFEEAITVPLDVGADPIDFLAQCTGCRSVRFSLAQGQRIAVLVFSTARPTSNRSDLHVVNESGRRQRGAVRTGPDRGFGRTLLPFNLAPDDSASVGLRLPAGGIDFTLTCDHCDPQRLRLRNGVDLELVIR